LRTLYATLDDLRRTRGRFVIIGSVSGHISTPGASAYGMSKFAVRALAQSLRAELRRDGITVVLVSPGFVESEIHEVDNAGVRHAGTPHPQRRLRMPTATAARQIVRATARGRREAVITRHGQLAVFLQRHAPGLVATVISRMGMRARTQPGGGTRPSDG
jgi:short-subunit dehydrogenase